MPAESEPTPTPAGQRAGWTPDFILQFFKEIVTAVLGIAVVIYTLVLAGSAFAYAGDESKISDAKDILLLVLGLAGVVVGYYFGRVPADARATQAQERADEATVEAQGVRNEAQNAADELDRTLAQIGGAGAGGGFESMNQGATPAAVADLARVRNQLRDVAAGR